MLPEPIRLAAPPAPLAGPDDTQTDLWWISPQRAADLPARARARHLLHEVLAAYLGAAPLRLAREAKGRPYLAHPGAPDFNLSDTRGGTVIAVAGRGRIGIDLERCDRDPPVARLARRWFSAREADQLSALDAESARRAFLRLWTAKEAACKATGTGIFGWLPAWSFDPALEQPALRDLPEAAGAAPDWHFLRLAPHVDYTCVLAAWGFRPRLRHFFVLDEGVAAPRGVPRRQASLQ